MVSLPFQSSADEPRYVKQGPVLEVILPDALQQADLVPKQGFFYDGQVFDAYTFIADIIRKASSSIILIDNYVDDTVLSLFTKRKKGVSVTV